MLQDRVIIITGASRGLGRAMALELAARGARIVAAARTALADPALAGSLRETVDAIERAGGQAMAVAVDVRDAGQVRNLVARALAWQGRIDVLVNNAGIMVGDVAFSDTTPALWQEVIDTNLGGAFLCCREVVPHLLRQGGGVIVNITSGAAVRGGFLNLPYGVSKAGLDRLTLGLGVELQARGIACVGLSPPVSATATVRRMYPDRDVDAWAQPPELTALALRVLLEDEPIRHTGQVLSVREYLRQRGLLAKDKGRS